MSASRWLCGAFFGPPLLLTASLVASHWLFSEVSEWRSFVELLGFLLSAWLGGVCFWRALPGPSGARTVLVIFYLLLALPALLWYSLYFVAYFYDEYL